MMSLYVELETKLALLQQKKEALTPEQAKQQEMLEGQLAEFFLIRKGMELMTLVQQIQQLQEFYSGFGEMNKAKEWVEREIIKWRDAAKGLLYGNIKVAKTMPKGKGNGK